jgi:hypothetical protein
LQYRMDKAHGQFSGNLRSVQETGYPGIVG